ncbi:ribosome-recycling factor, mitochondrial [Ceratina calcarata]|uniref:Ribosome-recycling factor, mitochondrial n=1 Tax=Ceratina calcarata TaxID=156304 RepID=A0AAJ7WGQ2_9HYME|nr:ribosome-recycling factor, mitochondrial [Ceratina calcarata]XP_026675567.1 ribosome-recycling factor, mitochondrial [Ceratina calcarata]
MMNISFLRPQFMELTRLLKHVRYLHNLKSYKNVLLPSKSTNIYVSFYDSSFKLTCERKFSTANALFKSKDRYKEKKTVVHVDLNEIADVVKVDRMMTQFNGAIESYKEQMIQHLGVRTRAGSIEGLTVMFEDEEYNLEELVEISRKPNMLILNVSAFPQIIPSILEALRKSQMNLNPQQEGTTIYIPLPKVTKEHREQLAKTAKQYFVKCKEKISDIRNEHYRDLKKKQDYPEDLIFKAENYINALQKEYVQKAEQLLKAKQKELLGES